MKADTVERPNRWAPFLPSLCAAVGVPLWIIVVSIVRQLLGAVPNFIGGSAAFSNPIASLLTPVSLPLLAVALALLFSFWLLAPITANLRIGQLGWRILIAAGIVAVLLFPAELGLFAVISAQNEASAGGLYDLGFPGQDTSVGFTIVNGLVGVVQSAVTQLPLIALAALASWAWQRRSRVHGEA
ncbi:MAG: hypothetical protein ABI632_00965 [Pseudolysinimonas sp.]